MRKNHEKELRHRINAGRVAVEAQVSFFKDQLGRVASEWKEDNSRVTFADFAISEKVIATLRADFPKDVFCSEEANPEDEEVALDQPFAWILDPIDGTNNFAMGYPVCCIALALLFEGTPVYGIIYDMSRDLIMEGGPEFGYLEKKRKVRIDLCSKTLDHKTTIGLHFPLTAAQLGYLQPLLKTHRVRCLGSSALSTSYIANGLLDGVIDYRVKIWDIAAAYAIIMGAGARFQFFDSAIFPLTSFHVRMPATPFFAGTPYFCDYAQELLKANLV